MAKISDKSALTFFIKQKARDYGFLGCGIAKAEFLAEDRDYFKNWLNENKHGNMHWLKNHFEKRLDPRQLVENAKSIIVFTYNYYPKEFQNPDCNYKIAKYAYGKDYHNVVKKKLNKLLEEISRVSEVQIARCFVDSAPVLERRWAQKAGLGWIGKNTMLISKDHGSYFFIGEIICDIELDYDDEELNDYCGRCNACLNFCPTNALIPEKPYQMDASKCISYHTIENKEVSEADFPKENKDRLFGCDICLEVCPWNRESKSHNEPKFEIAELIKSFSDEDWQNMTPQLFEESFYGTPIKRMGFERMKKIIDYIKKLKT
jgi:epoxyqueuosine reductase